MVGGIAYPAAASRFGATEPPPLHETRSRFQPMEERRQTGEALALACLAGVRLDELEARTHEAHLFPDSAQLGRPRRYQNLHGEQRRRGQPAAPPPNRARIRCTDRWCR